MPVEPRQRQLTDNPGLLNGTKRLTLEVDKGKKRIAEGDLGDAAAGGRRPILIGEAAVVPERKTRQVGAAALRKGLENPPRMKNRRSGTVLLSFDYKNRHVEVTSLICRLPPAHDRRHGHPKGSQHHGGAKVLVLVKKSP